MALEPALRSPVATFLAFVFKDSIEEALADEEALAVEEASSDEQAPADGEAAADGEAPAEAPDACSRLRNRALLWEHGDSSRSRAARALPVKRAEQEEEAEPEAKGLLVSPYHHCIFSPGRRDARQGAGPEPVGLLLLLHQQCLRAPCSQCITVVAKGALLSRTGSTESLLVAVGIENKQKWAKLTALVDVLLPARCHCGL